MKATGSSDSESVPAFEFHVKVDSDDCLGPRKKTGVRVLEEEKKILKKEEGEGKWVEFSDF